MRTKMDLKKRAKIFQPFNALTKYYELLEQSSLVKEEKKIKSEDELKVLDDTLNNLKLLSLIAVTYYKDGFYLNKTGILTKIDYVRKSLIIVKDEVLFKDIDMIKKI